MTEKILITIMPTVDGRRRTDLHHCAEVGSDLPDEEVGEVMGCCLRRMLDEGISAGNNQIELNVRFA